MTALWLAALLAVAAQASGGYRVAGEVLNSASGQPVPGARVTLVPADRGGPGASAVTGDDGRFSFTGLPEGKYDLSGQRRGLLPSHRMGAIVTGPGQDTSSIVLRLPPPAVISGKVVDDAGDPVADAQVELLGSRIVEGRRRMIQESIGRTDDLGAYRFASLPAGGYYLVVSGVPWYTKFNPALGDTAPRAMTHAGYGIRYYPNAADPGAAEPLILKAGQEAEANFTLLPVPAVTVEVHCEQFENLTKHYALTMAGLSGNQVHVRNGIETGDLFHFWSVTPGHYTLQAEATDGRSTWYATNELDVAASDIEVDVALHPAPSLSGIVVAESSGSLPRQLTLLLRDATGRVLSAAMGSDGRFSVAAIPPGRYNVAFAGADDYDLRNWSAEGGRREGDLLNIPAGATVRLTANAAKGTGRIAGSVYRDGQPLSGALVVMAPAHRAVRTNSDGGYEFRGLPAAEYTLFAVAGGEDLEYANPAAIQPYLDAVKKVRTGPGGSENVRLDAAGTLTGKR